ncbi:hypothetical protein H5T57_04245 [Candidatus Bipolaricaulota bacterium]|nr:hypothetical protein [Candidatus Bipolaricaulota bacterium]
MEILEREHEAKFHEPRPSLGELEEKIREVDTRIDELVYELYGLTEKEMKIIEWALL